MKVIVISDNRILTRDIHFCLKVRWPDVVILPTGNGQEGIKMVEAEPPDLVIIDPNLPDGDMVELIIRIRDFSNVPLIVLTHEQSEMDKVRCLEAGADDCINTPFSPIELLTKVRVLFRRTWGLGFNTKEEQLFSVGDRLTINAGTREVLVADKPVRLTPIEYRLLLVLARNQGRVVPHQMLLQLVWGNEYVGDIGFLKRYVYRLRQKLQADNNRDLVRSERGIGYKLANHIGQGLI